MRNEPMTEWQRLTEHYGQMSDGELYELDEDRNNLTDVARQVLSEAMKSRGLEEYSAAKAAFVQSVPLAHREREIEVPDAEGESDADGQPHEFTWKVQLTECAERQQALQLQLALKEAGIESWLEGLQVLVAADQLDQAEAVAAQPIPQSIIDQFQAEPAEFELPVCPRCGAADPILLSADPLNTWECEACEAQWTDIAPTE